MISALSHFRISSFTASHTLGLSRRWASLTGLDSSSKNMRWVHNEGSNPLKYARVQPIACSFCRNTSSNHFSCSSLSWEEMITGLTCWESRKAYLSVDGRGLSSPVGSLTCRFRASLKHEDDGQTKFIKPNSQRQDIIIKYWVSI